MCLKNLHKNVLISTYTTKGSKRNSYQEYERVYNHQCNPKAVKVIVEPLIQMSQSLKISFHTTSVTGTGYYRQDGKWSIDEKPGLSAVEDHLNDYGEDDGGDDSDDGDDVPKLVQKLSDKITVNIYLKL